MYPGLVPTKPPPFRDPLFLGALAGLFVVFWGLQLARGFGISQDELFCPTSAILLEAGLPLSGDRLMLKSFCGGCAVNTLFARTLFSVLPVQVWVWRLVPFAFGLVILGATWRLGGHLAGRAGAATAAWAFVLAPPAYRHMAIQGFANHVEVMALVLAALLAVRRLERGGGRRDAFVLGLLSGAAVFYAYIAAFIVPTVALAWIARREPRLPPHPTALLAGLGVGFSPWFLVRLLPPQRSGGLEVHGRTLAEVVTAHVGLAERLGVLLGPQFRGNLFAPEFEFQTWIGGVWVVLAGAGLLALALAARSDVLARTLATGIGLFVLEWLVLAPGLPTWPPVLRGGGTSIHYFVPLLTLLPIAAAALWSAGPLRRAAAPVTAGLLVLGLVGLAGDFRGQWVLGGMDRPPIDLTPGAVQISSDLPIEPGLLVAPDVDAAFGLRPGRVAARRVMLENLGRMLPGAMAGWSAAERLLLVDFLEALPPADDRWLFSGLAWSGIERTDLPAPLPPALREVLGPWPAELTLGLLHQARRAAAIDQALNHGEGPGGRIADLAAHLGEETDPVLRQQLAWEIGATAATAADPASSQATTGVDQLETAVGMVPPLPEDARRAALLAVVDGVVEDRCGDKATCAALRARLADAEAAFDEAVCAYWLRCASSSSRGPTRPR